MEILRASEDYLESMLMMKLKHGYIRSIDVAEHLGVTKPSVTYATRRLKESGHITMDKDGLITLTETGMAVAAKHWGDTYRTYALLGDGESEEGQVWEAAMFAGNQQLDNLCVIVDHNGLQIDGPVEEVNDPMPLADKFRAFKFHVVELADGNDFDQIRAAFAEARATKGQPTAIIAETTKGKGVSFMENQVGWHGKAPNDEQFEQAMAELTAAGEEL